MGNDSKHQREQLYDLFCKNLELVKQHKNLKVYGERVSGYICPLCFKIFGRCALSANYDDRLTLEDVPPVALGGSVKLLTCKVCNNQQGSKLDNHLVEYIATKDFLNKKPNVERRSRFITNDYYITSGKIWYDENGKIVARSSKKSSHPEHYHELFKSNDVVLRKVNFQITGGFKVGRPQKALLRIAYLWMVSEFGYSCILNQNMQAVRKQINQPNENFINNIAYFEYDFPNECEGINLLHTPADFKSFAIAVNLITKASERKVVIILPGPESPGIDVYDKFAGISGSESKMNFNLTKIQVNHGLTDPEIVEAYEDAWNWG